MSDIRDFFIKTLDESEKGINAMMTKFVSKINTVDPKVHERLMVEQDIKPQYFSFRWLTLMLSQEFPLPDVLRIWDSLLSDDTRSDFLIDVCTAMVVVIRDDILTNDFAENMKLLQVSFLFFDREQRSERGPRSVFVVLVVVVLQTLRI